MISDVDRQESSLDDFLISDNRAFPKASVDRDIFLDYSAKILPERLNKSLGLASERAVLAELNCYNERYLNLNGVLLFTERPSAHIKSAFVQLSSYEGSSKASPRRIATSKGPIFRQIDDGIKFILDNIEKHEYPVGTGAVPEDIFEFPMRCVREIVLNSMCHKNYDDNSRINYIRIYPDKIEVENSGIWEGVSPDTGSFSMLDLVGQPIHRNLDLSHALSVIRYAEVEGSGLTVAVEDCLETGAQIPTVDIQQGFVKVTIWPSKSKFRRPIERKVKHSVVSDSDHNAAPFIFLSYASANRPAAKRVKRALEAEGLSVWWDQDIAAGAKWKPTIIRRLANAGAVATLLSTASVNSENCRNEARRAYRLGKLAPALIEAVPEEDRPLSFDEVQTADLTGWTGARDDGDFRRLVDALKLLIEGRDSATGVRLNEARRYETADQPMGEPAPREDPEERAQRLETQAGIAGDVAAAVSREVEAGQSNVDRRLAPRLSDYAAVLRSGDKLRWERMERAYHRAMGVVGEVDMLDQGLIGDLAELKAGHEGLEDFVRPAQTDRPDPPDDQADPTEGAATAGLLRSISDALAVEAPVEEELREALIDYAGRLEAERDDPDAWGPEAEARGRARTGRTLRTALGVTAGLAAGLMSHPFGRTEAGMELIGQLREAVGRIRGVLENGRS